MQPVEISAESARSKKLHVVCRYATKIEAGVADAQDGTFAPSLLVTHADGKRTAVIFNSAVCSPFEAKEFAKLLAEYLMLEVNTFEIPS